MAQPTQKSTHFSGVDISYTTYNLPAPQAKPTLLFIHGWCCNSALWRSQSPLYTIHPSILIDLPGHGSSSAPEDFDYSLESSVSAIDAVLQAENVSSVVVIGHSMGGCIGTLFLRLHPEKVRGVVYVSSFWLMPVHYLTSAQRKGLGGMMASDDTVMSLFEHAWSEKSTAAIKDGVRRTLCEQTPMHVRLGCVTTDVVPPHWRAEEVFDKIPLLQVTYQGAPAWDEQWRRHLPGLVTEQWEGVSVFLFMEDGERFNQRVERFLSENGLG